MRLFFYVALIVCASAGCFNANAENIFDAAEVKHERWKLVQNHTKGTHYEVECVMRCTPSSIRCLVHDDPTECPSTGRGNCDEDGDWSECKPEVRGGMAVCAEHDDRTDCPILSTWTPPVATASESRAGVPTQGSPPKNAVASNPFIKLLGLGGKQAPTSALELPCRIHQKNCGAIVAGSLPGVGKTLVEVGEVETGSLFGKAKHTGYAYVELPNP